MPPFPAARGTGRIDRCDHGAAKHSRQVFKVHCRTPIIYCKKRRNVLEQNGNIFEGVVLC